MSTDYFEKALADAKPADVEQFLKQAGPNPVCVNIIKSPSKSDWLVTKELTLGTMNKHAIKPVDAEWKRMLLLSEHSPLRSLIITWEWVNLPTWVSVHFVRHCIGITHFVSSQRNDRQEDYDRNAARQDTPVLHRCTANFEEILAISRKRLCMQASPETRYAWQLVLAAISAVEPELVFQCVPKCVYRGGLCGEPFKCKCDMKKLHEGYLAQFQGGTK